MLLILFNQAIGALAPAPPPISQPTGTPGASWWYPDHRKRPSELKRQRGRERIQEIQRRNRERERRGKPAIHVFASPPALFAVIVDADWQFTPGPAPVWRMIGCANFSAEVMGKMIVVDMSIIRAEDASIMLGIALADEL